MSLDASNPSDILKGAMTSIITDPDFSTLGKADSKWTILTHQGVEMIPTVNEEVLSLAISGTHGANWHGELRYAPFPVREGETFEVTFSARAERPFSFSVWLGQLDAPYKSLVPEENHFGAPMMNPDWHTYTHTWHPNLSEESARLNFVLGQIDNTVEIKYVRLSKI